MDSDMIGLITARNLSDFPSCQRSSQLSPLSIKIFTFRIQPDNLPYFVPSDFWTAGSRLRLLSAVSESRQLFEWITDR
jgi:hypothetical protein